jgi:ABC-type amino acid transport substrate-binding protein
MKDPRKSTPWQVVLLAVAVIPAIFISWVQAASPEQAPAPPTTAKLSRIIVVDDSSYAPFSYLDLNGKPAGIIIDIWKL